MVSGCDGGDGGDGGGDGGGGDVSDGDGEVIAILYLLELLTSSVRCSASLSGCLSA